MIVGKHGDVLCCINYFKTKVLHNHYEIAHLIFFLAVVLFVFLFLLDLFLYIAMVLTFVLSCIFTFHQK